MGLWSSPLEMICLTLPGTSQETGSNILDMLPSLTFLANLLVPPTVAEARAMVAVSTASAWLKVHLSPSLQDPLLFISKAQGVSEADLPGVTPSFKAVPGDFFLAKRLSFSPWRNLH